MTRGGEPPDAVVVGGGLAGMAAALALADAGRRVTLVERRPFLGGRAFSFRDPDADAVVDNGQHVLVGACDRLRAFLGRIGSAGAFVRQPRLALPVLDASGRRATLRATPLPPPFHLLPSLLAYRHLSPRARWATARDVRALARAGRSADGGDAVALGAWLRARGSAPETLERFWDPLVRPALNVAAADADLALVAFLVDRALWAGPAAGAMWLPATGLGDAIGEPGGRALDAAGVDVRTGTRATGLLFRAGRATGVRLADGALASDAVVAAVPPGALDRLLADVAPSRHAEALGASPIVNVYLWYDRPVLDLPFVGAFGAEAEWIFDRARLLGSATAGGPCVGVSLSAADRWIDRPKEEIARRVDASLARLLPGRGPARRLRWSVVKEPRATFRATPGAAARRPGPEGPLAGLWLAGDWTATGWPATMEGAVRSGETAAARILEAG